MMMIENEPDPLRRIPTKRPAEIHAEVGAILRAARLKRGQSLEAVAQQTRIPKRFLSALEEDRLDEFPAFVYMRGFLKSYCDHLDLSFDELWAKVQPVETPAPAEGEAPAAAPAASAPAPAAPTPVPASKPAAKAAPAPKPDARAADDGHATAAPHARAPITPRPLHAREESSSATGAIVFAAACAVALGVWMLNGRRAPKAPQAETPKALMPLPRTTEPHVELKAVEDAWVRASVDGQVVFEGRVPRGAAMDWKPSRNVTLRTTAASALRLIVNGAPYELKNPTPEGEYKIDLP